MEKYNKDDFDRKLKEMKLTLIEGEVKGLTSSIIVEDELHYKYFTTPNNIIVGGKLFKFQNKNKFTIENIKLHLKHNYPKIELLSTEYHGADSELKFRCKEHGMVFDKKMRKLKGCPKCTGSYVYSLSEVVEEVNKTNPHIKVLREYTSEKNGNRMFECECLIDGHIWSCGFYDLFNHGCIKCHHRNMKGEGNYWYNHDKTQEERETKREYTEYYDWRKSVYERDSYVCRCCGYDKGKILNAHHLNGYDWDEEHRVDTDNGVTLCKECHKEFHDIYGYGENTLEQFKEYYKEKTNLEFNVGQ